MKYFVRSLKYFLYLAIVLCLVLLALVAFKIVDADISTMFVKGYASLWQIAGVMAVFAAVYPMFGYSTRALHMAGAPEETAPVLVSAMENRGYKVESRDGDVITFVSKSPVFRLFRVWEDRLTFTRTATGYDIEGPSRDVVRVLSILDGREA